MQSASQLAAPTDGADLQIPSSCHFRQRCLPKRVVAELVATTIAQGQAPRQAVEGHVDIVSVHGFQSARTMMHLERALRLEADDSRLGGPR